MIDRTKRLGCSNSGVEGSCLHKGVV
uniref:Uncharacterized protein n=1 Tax=Rhizophora mucronata TaxID=61149 RepID=A0A2P2QSZ0_RHIMU